MGKDTNQIKHIVILDDGKKGHLNQSLAVAEYIVEDAGPVSKIFPVREALGPEKFWRHPRLNIISIHHKTKLHRFFLSLICFIPLSSFFSKFFLFLTLSKISFDELSLSACEIVISTGSSLNPVNILYASWRKCKNIVVMKPSWGRDSQYTLQIIPKHDNPRKKKNIIVTLGAPSILNISFNAPFLQTLGILIGGNSKYHSITLSFIEELILQLKNVNLDFLITTSPRTPADVDTKIKTHFSQNYTPSIEKIFTFASILIVTEDSISMISEALNTGKKIIVLEVPTHKKQFKHRQMIQSLAQDGYVRVSSIADLSKNIDTIVTTPMAIFDDRLMMQKAIENIL